MSPAQVSPIREIRDENGVMVVCLAGSLCGDDATKVLLEALHGLEPGGRAHVVLDLGGLIRIDSAGLGAIASAYVSVTRASGRLALASAPSAVRDLLSATLLLQIIPLYPDTASAQRALRP